MAPIEMNPGDKGSKPPPKKRGAKKPDEPEVTAIDAPSPPKAKPRPTGPSFRERFDGSVPAPPDGTVPATPPVPPTPEVSTGGQEASTPTTGGQAAPIPPTTALRAALSGFTRFPWAVLAGLVIGWSGLFLALWTAALGLVLGIFVAVGWIALNTLTRHLFTIGLGEATGTFAVLFGAIVGAGGAFTAVYGNLLFGSFRAVEISVLSGAVIGVLITLVVSLLEGDILRAIRGCRPLTREETRRIAPLLQQAGTAMNLATWPRVVMKENLVPGAWTHTQHIVLSTGLYDVLEDGELRAVLEHELHHWRKGDCWGALMVSATAWPILAFYNLGAFLSGTKIGSKAEPPQQRPGKGIIAVIAWFLMWPAWLLVRLVLGPLMGMHSRQYEYEADAAVMAAGDGEHLVTALRKIDVFETGRTGWEEVMCRTHPTTRQRIDRLQPAAPDDGDFLDEPLGRINKGVVGDFAWAVGAVIATAIVAGAIVNYVHRPPTGSVTGQPQTTQGAVDTSAAVMKDFFTDALNAPAYHTLLTNNAVAGDGPSLISVADGAFLQAAQGAATSGDPISSSASSIACTQQTQSPTSVTAHVMVAWSYSVNKQAGESWWATTAQMEWTPAGWRIASITPGDTYQTPPSLDGWGSC